MKVCLPLLRTLMFSVLSLSFMPRAHASNRIGLGISAPAGASIVFDHAPVFNESWSLGGEFFGTVDNTLFGAVRALYWQDGQRMSGFYGGPKLGVALGNDFGVAAGGNFGWMYRFANGIDISPGLDIWGVRNGVLGGLRFDVGYLFE